MKRRIAFLLSVIIVLQSSLSGSAAEYTQDESLQQVWDAEEYESAEEYETAEEYDSAEETEEAGAVRDEITNGEEYSENLLDWEIQEEIENPEADPLYARAHGHLVEGFTDEIALCSERESIHDSRFDGYTIENVIDVSSYQKNIEWTQVKQSGINYAIIRAGFRGYAASGSLNTDAMFTKNIKEATAAGIKVGVYFFSQATTEKEAVEEANFIMNLIAGYDVTLPVIMDVEFIDGPKGRLYDAHLSASQQTKICKAFCSAVLEQGYTPMVYANKSMLENNINASDLTASGYKIWLARYNSYAGYSGNYEFWQYTDSGSVSGITANNGKVDKSYWYIDPKSEKSPKGTTVDISDTYANRLYGSSRYGTAFEVANTLRVRLGVSKFDTIIVASGKTFADALSGSYLAGKKNAPIILTNGKNAQDVKKYIRVNLKKGGTVYILGGTAAVPEGVGSGLGDYKVKRLAGDTRYETNLAILKEAGVSSEDMLICTGSNFADSLSGAATKKPILLVKNSLTNVQKKYLSSISVKKFYILGGTNAVNNTVQKEVAKYGKTSRIGGNTRYETSVLIAKTFFGTPTYIVLATADEFADGLCGCTLAMQRKSPLILTKTGKEAAAKEYAKSKNIHTGTVLGGNNSKLITNRTAGNILGWVSNMK